MHIPDGYLSPQTSAVFGVTMLPLWYQASRRVQRPQQSAGGVRSLSGVGF